MTKRGTSELYKRMVKQCGKCPRHYSPLSPDLSLRAKGVRTTMMCADGDCPCLRVFAACSYMEV